MDGVFDLGEVIVQEEADVLVGEVVVIEGNAEQHRLHRLLR